MKKPEFKLSIDTDCTAHEELIVRQMQNSDLHLFEMSLSTSVPENYDLEEMYPGMKIRPRDRANISITWELSLVTDNRRGWLVLVDVWTNQTQVDIKKELVDAFDEMFDAAGVSVDYEVKTVGWKSKQSGRCDVLCSWQDDNAERIDALFEQTFGDVQIGRVNGCVDALKAWGSVRDELELREYWAELDRMFG